ncbi:SNO1 [[Candida] subhashii]|uniref:glutaminase n=1 Tax=[Candida] subhashii TaxID=561895 RepID=A0A8J5QKF6_9ASCO|nr:SNO1 [[Candida] subhashii]KAG7662078.1 SNO1 [[Candida] subhashii]
MTTSKTIILGVLALQGAFQEHIEYFNKILETNQDEYNEYNIEITEIRTKDDLERCDSLVIPGGESTTMSWIAIRTHLLEPLYDFVSSGKPLWGTCAGLIFLAKELKNGKMHQKILGALNIQVTRNAFGRQLDSFSTHLDFSSFIPNCTDFQTVFIRAPVVTKILSVSDSDTSKQEEAKRSLSPPEIIRSLNTYNNTAPVEVLYSLKNVDHHNHDLIVAVRQGNVLGTSFHPELADDYRFHKWFLDEFVLKNVATT